MRSTRWLVAGALLLAGMIGCVNVKAPERIDVGGESVYGGDRSRPRNSNPQTLEEARAELRRAEDRIASLERKVADLERDKRKLKDKLDELEDKYDRLKDRD